MAANKNGIKKIGRPATGQGTPVMVRMQPNQLAAVDAWAEAQDDQLSRPEAVRRLVDWGLKATVISAGKNGKG